MKFSLFVHDNLKNAFKIAAANHQIKIEINKTRREAYGKIYDVESDSASDLFYFGAEFEMRSNDFITKQLLSQKSK